MFIKDDIFRQYDIRGIVGKDLDCEIACEIGRAFSLHLKDVKPAAKKVTVGRDVRLSSKELSDGIIKGILSEGFDVCDIGECPTPLQYFSLYHLDVDGGIMVTGSHNPPEYNGLKLSFGKETIHGEAIQEIRRIIRNGKAGNRSKKGILTSYKIIPAYREYMLKQFSYLEGT